MKKQIELKEGEIMLNSNQYYKPGSGAPDNAFLIFGSNIVVAGTYYGLRTGDKKKIKTAYEIIEKLKEGRIKGKLIKDRSKLIKLAHAIRMS